MKNKKKDPDILTVAQFAKKKGVSRDSVYKRLFTPETPSGDIVPQVDGNNKWVISWELNKHVVFKSQMRRTKTAV